MDAKADGIFMRVCWMKKVIGKNGEVFYFTKGKHPTHALQKAFDSKKEVLKKHAGEVLSREMGD